MHRVALLVLGLALASTGCHLGPGITCADDAPCSPWGRCGAHLLCVALEVVDAGEPDVGLEAVGVAEVEVATEPLDFGLTDCGGARSLRLAVGNTGSGALAFTARVSSPLFQVLEGSGSVRAESPAAHLTLVVHVPAASLPGQQYDGVLTLDSNDPARPRLLIPLHATASGVALVLTPSLLSFGLVPVNVDAPAVPVTFTNLGNQTATILVTQPLQTEFRVTGPVLISLDAGASFTGVSAHFRPTRSGPSSGSAALQVSEPLCGLSAVAVPMSGQGTAGVVGLSTTELFFGRNGQVACGAQSPARTFLLTNVGTAAFTWTAALSLGAGSPFAVTPSSGTVPAMGAVLVNLTSSPIPSFASTTLEAFSDLLTLTTDAPQDTPHALVLHQSAAGAALRWAPPSFDFGNVALGASAESAFALLNEGTEPVAVRPSTDAPAFSPGSAGPLFAPPGTLSLTARFEPGLVDVSRVTGSLTLRIVPDSGVLCAPLPALALAGTGTGPRVGFSPLALDFGEVDCGTTALPQVVTFTNLGSRSYRVTPSLGRGTASPFSFSMVPGDGLVAPDGGTLLLKVTPARVPSTSAVSDDLLADVLTVATDVVGLGPQVLPLHQTPHGAILSMNPVALSFSVVFPGSDTQRFSIDNRGNAAASFTLARSGSGRFSVSSSSTSVARDGGQTGWVTFKAGKSGGLQTGAVSLRSNSPLCAPLPPDLLLTGR